MSNDIDKELWRIQEQAMDAVVASDSADNELDDDSRQIKEYQFLYELLGHQPEVEPPSLLANNITKRIRNRHCKQRASKMLIYVLCALMGLAMLFGLTILLPQSEVLSQLGRTIPLPLLLTVLLAVCVVGWIQQKFIKGRNRK